MSVWKKSFHQKFISWDKNESSTWSIVVIILMVHRVVVVTHRRFTFYIFKFIIRGWKTLWAQQHENYVKWHGKSRDRFLLISFLGSFSARMGKSLSFCIFQGLMVRFHNKTINLLTWQDKKSERKLIEKTFKLAQDDAKLIEMNKKMNQFSIWCADRAPQCL